MLIPTFPLRASAPLSQLVWDKGFRDYAAFAEWIRALPYRRPSDLSHPAAVLREECGTCSSKHHLLWKVALEHGRKDIRLMLGIFAMSAHNTPAVAGVLRAYNLEAIPEAHNYLMCDNWRYDFTKPGVNVNNFSADLLLERPLSLEETGKWKENFHKAFIGKWLSNAPHIPYTLTEIWHIREACIQAIVENTSPNN